MTGLVLYGLLGSQPRSRLTCWKPCVSAGLSSKSLVHLLASYLASVRRLILSVSRTCLLPSFSCWKLISLLFAGISAAAAWYTAQTFWHEHLATYTLYMLAGALVASTILVIDATSFASRFDAVQIDIMETQSLHGVLLGPVSFCHRYILALALFIVFVDRIVDEMK